MRVFTASASAIRRTERSALGSELVSGDAAWHHAQLHHRPEYIVI
jgi:hypothetical protein